MSWSVYTKRIGKAKLRLNSRAFIDTIYHKVEIFATFNVLPMYREGVWNWLPEHQPEFSYHIYQMMNTFRVAIGTDSGNYDIYRYVDGGTNIRWAIMSEDWISKTQDYRYYSMDGQGRVVARGKSYMLKHNLYPKPGLKARDFTKQIMELLDRPWRLSMRYAVKEARIAMELASDW